jgi:hypothetical protein
MMRVQRSPQRKNRAMNPAFVSLRRAGVMPEEIRWKRVAQVKTRHRKDTIYQDAGSA